jgi:hypothetical protein
MPRFSHSLPDSTQSILRPVVISMTKQILEIMNIDPNIRIFYKGETDSVMQPGSEVESGNDKTSKFETGRYIFIDSTDDYDPNSLFSISLNESAGAPVFYDQALGVGLVPLYTPINVQINVKYRTNSESEAKRWREQLRLRLGQGRNINLHKLDYSYQLPEQCLDLLLEIYNKREENFGYGETLTEYIQSHTTNRLTIVSDQTNKNTVLSIAEREIRIQGYLDSDSLPEKPEKDDEKSFWTVSFAYNFSFNKPFAVFCKYPISVHNTLLPYEYINYTNRAYTTNNEIMAFQGSAMALRNFEADQTLNNIRSPNSHIKLPEFDDYVIPQSPNGTGTVALALVSLNAPNDYRFLLNLETDLDPVVLDKDIVDFLKTSEYPLIGRLYQSIFNLSLYKDDKLMSTNMLSVDQNLNVRSTYDLDPRHQWRVRIGLITDLTLLNKPAFDRMRKYPKAFVKLIGSINELLKNQPDFQNLKDQSEISLMDFSELYKLLTGFEWSGSPLGTSSVFGKYGNLPTWPSEANDTWFNKIDKNVMSTYLNSRQSLKTVMVSGIIACRQ